MNRHVFILIALLLWSGQTRAQDIQTINWSQSKTLVEQKIKQQRYSEAVTLLEKATEQTLKDEDLSEAYLLYTKIALKTGTYEVAEFYLNKLEPILSSLSNKDLKIQYVLGKLSLDFRSMKPQVLLVKIKSLEAQNEFRNDLAFQTGIKEIIILCNLKLGQYDSALVYLNENISQFKALNNVEDYSNALQNKAFCLVELNRPDSVLAMLNQSIQMARNEGILELQLEGLFMIGKYYLQFGPKEAALMHLDAARLLTQQDGKASLESRAILAHYYYEFYLSDENYKEALDWQRRYTLAKDSLYQDAMTLKSAFSESIKTIADQQSTISKNELIVATLVICLAVIGVFLVMQRRLIKLKSKSADKLRNQYHSLKFQRRALLDQKEFIESRNDKLESFLIRLETLANSSQVNQGNTKKALNEICLIIGESLNVARVSIWNYNREPDSITCRLLLADGQMSDAPTTLLSKDYPKYFAAIREKKLVSAEDAVEDPNTSEFNKGYLDVFDIKSLIDVPILLDGELAGIICCENVGEKRKWEPEDTIFLLAVSDFISITLLSEKIKSQNESLLEANLTLEDSVRMRTMELELQNKQLAEYAFVNSHLLRSPLAKILGIAEIMKYELRDENKQLVDSMTESAEELDVIVKQIGESLYKGKHFSREEINTMKNNIQKSQ